MTDTVLIHDLLSGAFDDDSGGRNPRERETRRDILRQMLVLLVALELTDSIVATEEDALAQAMIGTSLATPGMDGLRVRWTQSRSDEKRAIRRALAQKRVDLNRTVGA